MNNIYLDWLKCQIEMEAEDGRTYNLLTRILFEKEFYWTIPNDDNRAMEGEELREEFCEEIGYSESVFNDIPDGPARVLEVLIALGRRMAWQLTNWIDEKNTSECFWIFLENLDLLEYSDDVMDEEDVLIVHAKLDIWMDRRYNKSGLGSLFPLSKVSQNQKTTEIWYQMFPYIDEQFRM